MTAYIFFCILLIFLIKAYCQNKCYLDLGFFDQDEEFEEKHKIYETIYYFLTLILYILITIHVIHLIYLNISKLLIIIALIIYFLLANKENIQEMKKEK